MCVDEKMDHGPILAQQELAMQNSSFGELHNVLAKRGADLLIETAPKWVRGELTPLPQDDTKATYSKVIKKDDARFDWKKPAKYDTMKKS